MTISMVPNATGLPRPLRTGPTGLREHLQPRCERALKLVRPQIPWTAETHRSEIVGDVGFAIHPTPMLLGWYELAGGVHYVGDEVGVALTGGGSALIDETSAYGCVTANITSFFIEFCTFDSFVVDPTPAAEDPLEDLKSLVREISEGKVVASEDLRRQASELLGTAKTPPVDIDDWAVALAGDFVEHDD